MQQPNNDQRSMINGCNSSGGIIAAREKYGREMKKPRPKPGLSAALYLCMFLFSGATGFGFWPYGCAVGEIDLFVSLEINK